MRAKDKAVMKVFVTGGTGLIGRALVKGMLSDGYEVTVLTRESRESYGRLQYVQSFSEIPEGLDAVVNLAGAGLADKRWSDRYKREILDSRITLTRNLVDQLGIKGMPKVFLSGSAIGFYGADESASFTESDSAGEGFSANLCADWEAEARRAESEVTRLVLLRTGVVLDSKGGAFPQMTQSFKFGVGSWMGQGSHWLSWIHIEDMVSAIRFCLENNDVRGPVNMTAPEPATHRTFADAVSQQKPILLRLGMPAPVMRLVLGEMADELLLTGQKVLPAALLEHGFQHKYPDITSAVEVLI